MLDSEIKIPADFEPPPSPRQRALAWFWQRRSGRWFTRLRWERVTLALFALMMTAYLGVATFAYGFVRFHRGVAKARWVDIAFPWRWANYRVTRGDHLIAQAQRMVAERKFREAFLFARAGVAQSPANRDGRLLLAEMEQAARRPDSARRTFLEGLRYHHGNAGYTTAVLTFLLQQQADNVVVALAQRYLPGEPARSEAARFFALGGATASYFRGNYDQAEDFLRQIPGLVKTRDGRLLAAKIEWDRGYRDLALVQLRQLADERPHDAEAHRELAGYLRLRGFTDEARRRSLAFQIAHPELAWPRIELMRAYSDGDQAAHVAREIDALLREFGHEQAAVVGLADFASNVGDVALAERLVEYAAGKKWPREPFVFLMIEAQIVAGQYALALESLRAVRKENAGGEGRQEALFDSLRAVAALGSGQADEARAALMKFLGHENLRSGNLLAVANRLVALDATAEARQALVKALSLDPRNQAALTRLVELDIVMNRGDDLADHVQALLSLRRPSDDLLRIAQLKLGSDAFLFSPGVARVLPALGHAIASNRNGRNASSR